MSVDLYPEVSIPVVTVQTNENYASVYVPNVNGKLVRLSTGPASIERQNRARYIQLTAGIAPGVGLSEVISDLQKWIAEGDTKLPSDVRYTFAGDAENMAELATSTMVAVGLGFWLSI